MPDTARTRKLIQVALDALDAEKTPDFGVGHDRAVEALSEALNGVKSRDPYAKARMVPLADLPRSDAKTGEQS